MIALDSSAIVAMAFEEPEADIFSDMIADRRALVGTPTLVETTMVVTDGIPTFADTFMQRVLARDSIESVAFSVEMYQAATMAFRRFGKGRHPAKLNFGDCMAYAVAKVRGVPLLYKGDDFARTDIEAAWRP